MSSTDALNRRNANSLNVFMGALYQRRDDVQIGAKIFAEDFIVQSKSQSRKRESKAKSKFSSI